MLHDKFQNHSMFSGSGDFFFFAAYSHCSQFGHMTWNIYKNFYYPLLSVLYMKFGFEWPSVSEIFEIVEGRHIMYRKRVPVCPTVIANLQVR